MEFNFSKVNRLSDIIEYLRKFKDGIVKVIIYPRYNAPLDSEFIVLLQEDIPTRIRFTVSVAPPTFLYDVEKYNLDKDKWEIVEDGCLFLEEDTRKDWNEFLQVIREITGL